MIQVKKQFLFTSLLVLCFLKVNAQQPDTPTVATSATTQKWAGPDVLFGKLFADAQLKAVFPDSKTFADCTPKFPAAAILASYDKARLQAGFNLKAFVLDNFTLPIKPASGYTSKASQTAQQHIMDLWPVLTRPAQKAGNPIGSLIPLPNPYVVPGGRFGEIYYWDSYFTMLGLQVSGQGSKIRNMVNNFAYEIKTFGFIPNGNRTYFLGRSQPPFFSLMVNLLSEIAGQKTLLTYLPQLQQEYNFWMDGKAKITPQNPAYRSLPHHHLNLTDWLSH